MKINKEIYSFDVELKNKEDSSVENYRIVIKSPSRRESEDADLEYSIEISNLLKKGVMTKAMLLKKYDELTGGDQHRLKKDMEQIRIKSKEFHIKSFDLKEILVAQKGKKRITKAEKEKTDDLKELIANLKQELIMLEAEYSQLFEFTADTKAAQKQILWYFSHLTYYSKDGEEDWKPLVEGKDWQEKRDFLYKMEEEDDDSTSPLLIESMGKCLAFISLWYHSVNPNQDDFEELDNDIETGRY